jgi:LacI family transcriptional regulator
LKAEICLEGDWSPRSGYLATKEILKDKSVTTIFSANDDMALGAYRAINELGFSIPDRISLVGFDDAPASAFLSPGLTSIRQDFDQVGHVALGLLMKMIRGERPRARKILVAPELIERQSTTRRSKK